MKDAASNIANKSREGGGDEFKWSVREIAADINAAIRRAVKSERERCVGIVAHHERRAHDAGQSVICTNIIRKINTPAKRPSRRK